MQESLGQRWAQLVRAAPGARAFIDGATGRSWTRAELHGEASRWLTSLGPAKPRPGDRVLMAEPNGIGWISAFVGLLQAGAVPAAADSTEPVENLPRLAHAIGARAVVRAGGLAAVDGSSRRKQATGGLIKLTSGSTGLPKPLFFTDAQMLADGAQVCATMGILERDVNLTIIPLGHSYALGNVVIPLLAQGTVILCSASPLPHAIATDCRRWHATVFPAVPTLLQAMVQSEIDPTSLASLRLIISAGAPLAPAVAQAFHRLTGQRVHGFYGSSETGGITFDRTGEATLSGRSVGTPLEGVTLHCGPRRTFAVESRAVVGRGRFTAADYGMLNAEGELVLLGRRGRMMKIAGRRLNLAEVEATLMALDAVRFALAAPDPARPERVAAVVETDHPAGFIREQLGRRLAPWKVPARIIIHRSLPVTARGKPDRVAITALLRGR